MPQHQFGGQTFGEPSFNSVNPSDLTMNGSFILNNQYGTNNMSSSFLGNSNIADDELRDLIDESANQQNAAFGAEQHAYDNANDHQNTQSYFPGHMSQNSVPVHTQPQHMPNQMYSHTPDGAPIQSPLLEGGFNFTQQFQSLPQRQSFQHHTPASSSLQGSSFMNRQQSRMGLERQLSDSRSPMTPKTPALGALHLNTPDSGSFPSQPILAGRANHGHHKSLSGGQWDNTPGSGGSWVDSPISSPHQGSMHHPQIADVMAKHASLPSKVDGVPGSSYQTQEAKRRRRRESHNMVERRRRDNINERIQDLSKLVPQHRLEDEKIRKHIHNNGPMSPTMTATGISPPQATSLLAGGNGRRAAGSITQGLPIDEKDKGPNKGDILNGSVSWTRDLMWMLYLKIQQEQRWFEQARQMGQDPPYEYTEEELRMRTELYEAIERNGWETFHYTRGPGSGLRVPNHTNVAGDPIQNSMSPQSLSPAMQPGPSVSANPNDTPSFFPHGHGLFKEEDEYEGEMEI
ncbi:hypothetical protein K490DRAFT_37874 [Saccharata proteae CBS 121410]|uniref:BHLH domain-containing protein n=1 Tax=Saccharata proteae CBS 121410 TaxID=1314787 RepID=A0A6A5YD81_9PEZI|nr:hypothetical protein K490DRAFT_37874 [Saccharata proteae CBS 121410]